MGSLPNNAKLYLLVDPMTYDVSVSSLCITSRKEEVPSIRTMPKKGATTTKKRKQPESSKSSSSSSSSEEEDVEDSTTRNPTSKKAKVTQPTTTTTTTTTSKEKGKEKEDQNQSEEDEESTLQPTPQSSAPKPFKRIHQNEIFAELPSLIAEEDMNCVTLVEKIKANERAKGHDPEVIAVAKHPKDNRIYVYIKYAKKVWISTPLYFKYLELHGPYMKPIEAVEIIPGGGKKLTALKRIHTLIKVCKDKYVFDKEKDENGGKRSETANQIHNALLHQPPNILPRNGVEADPDDPEEDLDYLPPELDEKKPTRDQRILWKICNNLRRGDDIFRMREANDNFRDVITRHWSAINREIMLNECTKLWKLRNLVGEFTISFPEVMTEKERRLLELEGTVVEPTEGGSRAPGYTASSLEYEDLIQSTPFISIH